MVKLNECIVSFWSYKWDSTRHNKPHYVCEERYSEVTYKGYHFTHNKQYALHFPVLKGKKLARDISIFALFSLIQ